MKNFIQHGRMLDIVVPSGGVSAGKGILIGVMFGVAAVTAAQNAIATIDLEGVFTLDKTTGEAWTAGAALYWNDTTKKVTTTVGSNVKIGVAAAAAASADTVGNVRLNGSF